MLIVAPDSLLVVTTSILLVFALCAALVLLLVAFRRPTDVPLLTAVVLVAVALVVTAIVPWNVPLPVGLLLALLATAIAVPGGDPLVRRVFRLTTKGGVREGVAGGILVDAEAQNGGEEVEEVLRGGTWIGYLERTGVVLALIAGYPEALAIVVAVKGIGRFSELATPAARERFLIGTLASLVWAGLLGALVRLAIW